MDRWYGRLACGAMSSDRADTLTPNCARCELLVVVAVVVERAMMESKIQASDVLMSSISHLSGLSTRSGHPVGPTIRMMDANSESKQFEPQ